MIYAIVLVIGLVFFFLHLKRRKKGMKYPFKEAKLSGYEIEFLDLLNAYRKVKGVNELIVDEVAGFTAFHHNTYMILNDKVSHEGYGKRVDELMKLGAYEVGEITSGYYATVTSTFKAFLNSQKHEPTMKSIRYNACGLSVTKNDNGKMFITCLFLKI